MPRPNKSALKKPIWQEPPAPRSSVKNRKSESPWVVLRRHLMSNPNKWGVISIHRDVKSASASKGDIIKRGIFPKGEFDLVARTVNGKGRIYARYVLKVQDTPES